MVGSLPTSDGTAKTATAGALYVLNSDGHLVETISGGDINGPWDMASYDGGTFGVLFVTNVLNGTVAAGGSVVHKGSVVRVVLDLTTSPPMVLQRVVVASGFAEKTDPAALVIGPTGVTLGPNGTVYVADTISNRITAVADGLFRSTSAGVGTSVSSGEFLNAPLGLVTAPNGDLLSVNAGNGQIVESTLTGGQPEWPTIDSSGSPPGAGALFGLAIKPGGKDVVFRRRRHQHPRHPQVTADGDIPRRRAVPPVSVSPWADSKSRESPERPRPGRSMDRRSPDSAARAAELSSR